MPPPISAVTRGALAVIVQSTIRVRVPSWHAMWPPKSAWLFAKTQRSMKVVPRAQIAPPLLPLLSVNSQSSSVTVPPAGEQDVLLLANGDLVEGFVTALGDPVSLELSEISRRKKTGMDLGCPQPVETSKQKSKS